MTTTGKTSPQSHARWQRGASGLALAVALFHAPLQAQTAAILRASAGLTSPVVTAPVRRPPAAPVAPNAAGMGSASARAIANQAAAANAQSLAVQANQAARAAAAALPQTLPNGLVAGGLVPVANGVAAALDPTGLRTWQGASAPVQTGSDTAPTVTITQTSQRALLSWESFNVGRSTTLEFKQQPDWVVFNRIVANIDPATGRLADTANLRPSQILGTIKSNGTVLVINQNGVIFGATAQINTRSLLVSSLEIGAQTRAGNQASTIVPTGLSDRGVSFLQSGLIGSGGGLLSSVAFQDGVTVGETTTPEGAISIAAGAAINGGKGGFVIIAAPQVTNAGQISSPEGQVSLQSGRQVFAVTSSGASNSVDPQVRGLVLTSRSRAQTADSVTNAATGVITAERGYVSLGATATGSVSTAGVITSTTSVSRNGKVALTGGSVSLAPGATIAITPDTNGDTIPQGDESVLNFQRSAINIGGAFEPETDPENPNPPPITAEEARTVRPSVITIGSGSLIYAPSARVNIGGTNDNRSFSVSDTGLSLASSLLIDSGAIIDVGGIKDFAVPASRNSIQITPVKRNELRDTPNYREETTDGSFTLNGATLLVDPRLSGVRADGVAWVGSPLIEAESYFAQIGVTAAELMTKGGDLTLGVRNYVQGDQGTAPAVTVRPGAVLDVSGGWVRYEDGVVATSRLRTSDGRIVEIGRADPNDDFVAVLAPITAEQPRFGLSQSFGNSAQIPGFEVGYTEGRDAGSITIKASTTTLDSTLYADAFAGTRQIANANAASAPSDIVRDLRLLQAAPSQLPSGGLLKVTAIVSNTGGTGGGADIVVYSASGPTPARPASEILLSDRYLSGAGLSQVTLQSSGKVSFLAGSSLTLPADGVLVVDAGRSIRFDGSVSIPSGTIAARTYAVETGSVFLTDDDLPEQVASDAVLPRLFDINVNGLLSTRGRWSNDFLVTDGAYLGSAYVDGGLVSLEVAPRVLVEVAPDAGQIAPSFSADFSGSLFVNPTARIDVSAGGYVRSEGTLALSGRGGDVALINQTSYSQLVSLGASATDQPPRLSLVNRSDFIVTFNDTRLSSLAPRVSRSEVFLAPGTITAQGFVGGGSFTLVTPDLNFGARAGASGTALPLDFVSTTGFANVTLTTNLNRFIGPKLVNGVEVNSVFSNGQNGTVVLLDTETVTIGADETLNLTQSLIETLPTEAEIEAARNLATGGDIRGLLGTAIPDAEWDRRPVALRFGGLTEVEVLRGGLITGSAQASLSMAKLYNAGTIRIAGGRIIQDATLPGVLVGALPSAIGVSGLSGTDGLATVFGTRDADGLFDENAPNALGIQRSAGPASPVLANADLVAEAGGIGRPIYLTARLGSDEGIRLASGSVVDLSGTSIRNPRAGARAGSTQKIEGRMVAGGTLQTATRFLGDGPVLSPLPAYGELTLGNEGSPAGPIALQRDSQLLIAEAGSRIDLRGASDQYDVEVSLGRFELAPVWSAGGRLSLGAGGSLTGSVILASGGARNAEGGVLTWLNPILTQTDVADQLLNVVSANQIMAAGFSTFVAQNRLTTLGNVSLTLGRGFYLTAQDFDGISSTLNLYRANLATTGNLAISAPYIRLESPQQAVRPEAAEAEPGGQVTLTGRNIDIVGAVYAEPSVTQLTLNASNDVRLTGVRPIELTLGNSTLPIRSTLTGQLVVNGNLTVNAGQIYTTTGTGSLQQDINNRFAGTQEAPAAPFLIASAGTGATIRFGRSGSATPAGPYSAGGNLLVQAENIVQDGVLRVPLGRLALGSNTELTIVGSNSLSDLLIPATQSLVLGSNGITSVAASGLVIPYGETTDLAEYFFSPASDSRLFAPPAAELLFAGTSVVINGTVDATGGGDIYAYEFVPGVGGSRDVLNRFNSDPFSGNNGLQFADGRQVYAILPSFDAAGIALYDPIYSADYGALYGATDAGRRVFLEAGPGLAEGWYTLLPARYALLPGGMRVVENVGDTARAIGDSARLRDGSIVVNGRYGIAGTDIETSERRTFTVYDQATIRKASNIQLTSGSKTFKDLATRNQLAIPQLPADAARIILAPVGELAINTRLLTDPTQGGRRSNVDVSGNVFEIVVPGATVAEGSIRLTTTDFANLNAASLLIGGVRTDRGDGTTSILATATSILVQNDAANPLTAPEVVLVVDGLDSSITIADGSVLTASGQLVDTRDGDYIMAAAPETGQTAIGGMVRVANGPQRLLTRPGDLSLANSLQNTNITIGEATLTGDAILLNSSRDLIINDNNGTAARPLITARTSLALGGDDVFFTNAPSGFRGLVITPELEAQFAAAENLVITTPSIIGFSGGTHGFRNLTIDSRGIRPYGQATVAPPPPRQDQIDVPVADLGAPITVTINADTFNFTNSEQPLPGCSATATVQACGSTGNNLIINARQIALGSGPMATFGFDNSVRLAASEGIYVQGVGTLNIGKADFEVATPYFGDRALAADPRIAKLQPSLGILTEGAIRLAGTGVTAASVTAAPGATLAFGTIDAPVESFSASGLEVRATAGGLDVRSTGSIVVSGTTTLAVPGFSKTFGDAGDAKTVSAPGGYLSLVSLNGDVDLGAAVRVSIGGGIGTAGTLQLSAAQGRVVLPGTIDAAAPEGKASIRIDSGTAALDLAAFLAGQGKAFTGDVRIRTGQGDLAVAAGQTLRAENVRLTADGGTVSVAGKIDTSGINGGAIGLFGTAGVTLLETAELDASATGYGAKDTRAAKGGTIEIGTSGSGEIIVASGATINVAAKRPGARLIEQIRKDALTLNDTITYNYAQSDVGGTVAFRAPVVLDVDGNQTVDISYAGTITGARDVSVEGYRVYDLATLALVSGCTGADICINAAGEAVLDVNAAPGSRPNILSAIAPGTIPDFVRNFDLGAATGLGALTADPNFRARPGVQLEYGGTIVLASNWNLGAATVNQAAAIADGLMAQSPHLGPGYTYVVPGSEAALYNGFSTSAGVYYTDFTYRVGGRASGAAGILTLRAGGDLDIRGSITDGFFNFSDQTDPAFLSFQLGGGNRQYQPGLQLTCSAPAVSCTELFTAFEFVPGATAPPYPLVDVANIRVAQLARGLDIVDVIGPALAPYSARANSAGALGNHAGGAGDPIGSASLAPLLADGTPAESFSLRLVSGAAVNSAMVVVDSADATSVAPSATGSVRVSGESSYRAVPLSVPQTYRGDLQLVNFETNLGQDVVAPPADFAATLEALLEATIDPSTYTRLTLTGATPEIRAFFLNAASQYFADNAIPADQYQFFGPPANPNILGARFDLIANILQSVSTDFGSRTGPGELNYPAPIRRPATPLDNPTIVTRSLIRTGTGSIEVAAAGDVDLTNGAPEYRTANGRPANSSNPNSAQTAGTAIYTAGHRVNPTALTATDSATGRNLSINPTYVANAVALPATRPNTQGVFNNEPVYADGGGDIRISAGRDVAARRDVWAEAFRNPVQAGVPLFANAGTPTQLWRPVSAPNLSQPFVPITNIRINSQLFSTGVGALGGGSVSVAAGRNVSELTVVSATSITTAQVSDAAQPDANPALALISYGGGNVSVHADGDVLGGQTDTASGTLRVSAGKAIASSGQLRMPRSDDNTTLGQLPNLLRARVADATATLTATKSVTIGGIASTDGQGFYSQAAGVSVAANGNVDLVNAGVDILPQFSLNNSTQALLRGALLPGSLSIASLAGDINLNAGALVPVVLVPSPVGQLQLFASGDISQVTLAMDDGDPSLTPGPLSAYTGAILNPNNALDATGRRLFGFPGTLPLTSDNDRRRIHNERITHLNNPEPVRIFAGGNIDRATLWLPKQARIGAGGDITDMVFIGQNLAVNDVTRITAGGDIIGTSRTLPVAGVVGRLQVLQGNNFVLGGPGSFFIEAGGDLGPFFNSATTNSGSYAGGIISVGNDYNPWLGPAGAKIYAQFGVGKGAEYDALRRIYVDPANVGALDGDLFVQTIDINGNRFPDRSKPIYATALVGWLVENQPDAATDAFGAPITITPEQVLPLLESLDPAVLTQFLFDLTYLPIGGGINSPTVAIDRSVAASPVLITGADVATAPPAQRTTISGSNLIGWLAQNAPSVLTNEYGVTSTSIGNAYSALVDLPPLVQRQFLLDRVYFNELAAPSRPDGASSLQYVRGYRAVDTLFPGANGYTANNLDGTSNGGTEIPTGNLDLRLATLQSQRGGDVTILGPGGRVLGGSIVSRTTQVGRRGSEVFNNANLFLGFRRTASDENAAARILDIPVGFEGVLTLRGGSVRSFTDGDFLLNQSRLFTLQGGDITLWSSNGDLNAGQGAKTAANNPPVVIRFNPNGFGVLDQAGTVAGAGIAAQQPPGVDRAPDVTLVAPAGTVDAGDAGVRASGNVFVAAASIANADNFQVGGTAFGNIASSTVDTGAAAAANSASVAAAQAADAANPSRNQGGNDQGRITVEVVGFAGEEKDDPCALPVGQRPSNCPAPARP